MKKPKPKKKPKARPKKYDEKLFINMPFLEAVERFFDVKPAEMQANIDKAKGKKKPSGRPDGKSINSNVVQLRSARKRNYI